MGKRRVFKSEIRVGQKLAWDVFNAEGQLLLRRGQTVETHNQIDKLLDLGLFVDAQITARHNETEPNIVEESRSALSLILEARRRWQYLSSPTGIKDNFAAHVFSIQALIGRACAKREEVALAAILLDRAGRYSIRHSVDTATLCHLAGVGLGMSRADIASIVAAALTMNMSMLLIQDGLLNQRPPLPPDRIAAVRRHPEETVQLLRQLGINDDLWLQAVLDHHESLDGSGYPAGKQANEIGLPAQLIALADRYCAAITPRDYRPALLPPHALRQVLGRGGAVDKNLATQLISILGPFPPGTAVRLANDDVAVVARRGPKANEPEVYALASPRGVLATPVKRDTAREAYALREAVDWTRLGRAVNMQAVWGKDAALT